MYPLSGWPVTQTWQEHINNAGPRLGGVDHKMPIGTPLPVLAGVLEWVTPATPVGQRPAWYNAGLGNAAAYRRPDGTRTVYGHCSTRSGNQVFSGNTGRSTGPHVHVHDVRSDGVTRTYPFSLIKDSTMRVVKVIDGPHKDTTWAVGEFSITHHANTQQRDGDERIWGPADHINGLQFDWIKTDVEIRRNALLAALNPSAGGTLEFTGTAKVTT